MIKKCLSTFGILLCTLSLAGCITPAPSFTVVLTVSSTSLKLGNPCNGGGVISVPSGHTFSIEAKSTCTLYWNRNDTNYQDHADITKVLSYGTITSTSSPSLFSNLDLYTIEGQFHLGYGTMKLLSIPSGHTEAVITIWFEVTGWEDSSTSSTTLTSNSITIILTKA